MADARSGRLNVRLPTDLHAELAAEAERQKCSLNTLIVAILSQYVPTRAPTYALADFQTYERLDKP